MAARRFPPPWSIEDNGNCFIVLDGAGQKAGACLLWVLAGTGHSQSQDRPLT
jgi:hypothetical protein